MRKTTPMRVGDLWSEFVSGNAAVRARLAEARIPEVWRGLVGESVAVHTREMKLERGVLYVFFTSSVVRGEIFMRREELKDAINATLGIKAVGVIIVK